MSDEADIDVAGLIERARCGDAASRSGSSASAAATSGLSPDRRSRAACGGSSTPRTWCRRRCSRRIATSRGFAAARSRSGLAWLKRILARNAADFVRRYCGTAKRRVGREVAFRHPADSSGVGGVAEPAAPTATPSQEFLRIDAQLRAGAALAELPPDYQEVIVLRNLQRLSFQEVAARMGRSRPAVQMLWMARCGSWKKGLGIRDWGLEEAMTEPADDAVCHCLLARSASADRQHCLQASSGTP